MMATEDFATLTGLILEMALRNADITGSFHIVSILEGGYNLTALADSVASHLDTIGSFDGLIWLARGRLQPSRTHQTSMSSLQDMD